MKTLEVDEILKILEERGWQAWLCDTPVPVYESVHAGNPADPGQVPPGMVLMPTAFVKACQDSMVKVCGNSMADVGIHDGDLVKMTMGATPHDGDMVVVAIGNDCTVKCFHEDDNGVCWLLPQNKAEIGKYDAIRLDEEISEPVHLCGVVTALLTPLPRISGRKMRSTLAELRPQEAVNNDNSAQQVTKTQDDELVDRLKPLFYNKEGDVRAFLKEIAGMKPKDVTDLVNKWVTDKRISDYGNSRKGVLWEILHQAGLYEPSKQNWNRRVF